MQENELCLHDDEARGGFSVHQWGITVGTGEGGIARLSKGPACVGICRVIWLAFLPGWVGDGKANDFFKPLHGEPLSIQDA